MPALQSEVKATKVCLVAVPLAARSGVYMSVLELVQAAESLEFDWSGLVGIRADSRLEKPSDIAPEKFYELTIAGSNPITRYVNSVRAILASRAVQEADVVITLIPFSDIVVSRFGAGSPKAWVPFLRGFPWPVEGTTSNWRRNFWKWVEGKALKAAPEVWATTELLRSQVQEKVDCRIMPAGISLSTVKGQEEVKAPANGTILWAGRFSPEKNIGFFLEIMSGMDAEAHVFGTGPLEELTRRNAPANVEVLGWGTPLELWSGTSILVGTSTHEAFGRSAVEAAALGIPIVISRHYGAASLLYRDEDLRRKFVLDLDDPARWRTAIESLRRDSQLRERVSEHLRESAFELSIERSATMVHKRILEIFK